MKPSIRQNYDRFIKLNFCARIGITFGALVFSILLCPQCQAKPTAAKPSTTIPTSFSGNVSWYGPKFHGRKTASGEIFDMNKDTAAHLRLPFSTRVLVEDPRTGNTVIVKVNDRGPYVKTRVMDLARGAAKKLGTFSRGVAYVDCLVVGGKENTADDKSGG